ncbi:HNH endonuclease [Streptomyces scopuliridis]|uniref:HNH endonuclease n=1 Tax=Streptomyces scopuliridis TaxID=452529 RepID=UPI0036B81280
MCRRIIDWEQAGRDQRRRRTAVDRRVRNAEARRAVVLRSKGRCENPECLLPGLPYRTVAGAPLLEADHIDDHAAGGRDHPAAMIALCPNCHRNKTHGADRERLTECLRQEAARLHAVMERCP